MFDICGQSRVRDVYGKSSPSGPEQLNSSMHVDALGQTMMVKARLTHVVYSVIALKLELSSGFGR